MVSQIDTKLDFSSDRTRNPESTRHSSLRSRQNPSFRIDDVIASLANDYENRRARQVSEWERMARYSPPTWA